MKERFLISTTIEDNSVHMCWDSCGRQNILEKCCPGSFTISIFFSNRMMRSNPGMSCKTSGRHQQQEKRERAKPPACHYTCSRVGAKHFRWWEILPWAQITLQIGSVVWIVIFFMPAFWLLNLSMMGTLPIGNLGVIICDVFWNGREVLHLDVRIDQGKRRWIGFLETSRGYGKCCLWANTRIFLLFHILYPFRITWNTPNGFSQAEASGKQFRDVISDAKTSSQPRPSHRSQFLSRLEKSQS